MSEANSVDWVESVKASPPEHESVLMWYLGTERISAWAVVDKWHSRDLRKPDFWARINPPNAREKRAEDSVERLIGLRDCKPVPDGTRVACLPGGFVLLNATPTETKVIALYAAECLRLKPPEIIVECQPADSVRVVSLPKLRLLVAMWAGRDEPNSLTDTELLNYIGSLWDSQGRGSAICGIWFDNPTGSFRDAVRDHMGRNRSQAP